MRMSDWSSDVCSSDLSYASWGNGSLGHVSAETFRAASGIDLLNVPYQGAAPAAQSVLAGQVDLMFMPGPLWLSFRDRVVSLGRSEEHTSELQSLMRISYAVFCLKKKQLPRSHTPLT